MLSPDVAIVDIDGAHWARWQDLLWPHGLAGARWAVVFVDGARVIKAVVARRGDVDPAQVPFTDTSAAALAAIRRRLGVDAVVVLAADLLSRVLADAERRLVASDDYAAQWLTVWASIKAASGQGLWIDPPVLDMIPTPSADVMQRTFDLLVPDDTSLIAYVFDEPVAGARRAPASLLHTSIIAVKRRGDIALVTTHRAIAEAVGAEPVGAHWRRQTGKIAHAVADRFAPPSLAVFTDRGTFARVLHGSGDQVSREMAARNLVVDPAPAWLLGMVGGAAVAGIAGRTTRALARLLPEPARRRAGELAAQAQDALRASPYGPFALLGFDPIALWQWMRQALRPR